MKLAVIGSGIAGLAVAHRLNDHADVTLFEAGSYFGGHTHTVDVTLPALPRDRTGAEASHGVDTGFLVFNERTYPELIALLAELDVATTRSDMSFSAQIPGAAAGGAALEWSGSNLDTVFAQRANLLNPRFWGMLGDLLRFNRLTTALAEEGRDAELMQPLGDFLIDNRFGEAFRDWYFLPMMACIWSCPTSQMLRFPVATMVRFCHNHGLIQVTGRPQWWTVAGGARHYVDKITARIADKRLDTPVLRVMRTAGGIHVISRTRGETRTERFDKVVFATHSDQALALLDAPTADEEALLGAIRYHPNRAVLHTDRDVLPSRPKAWAAWNYERAPVRAGEEPRVCLHYLINRLQPVPWQQPVVVSLNPIREIPRHLTIGSYDYAHPVFDLAAIRAQARMPELQGRHDTYYCGAWMGYGFHEDGLKAGLAVARQLVAECAGHPGAPVSPARHAVAAA
jgi:predicted NAD/FAD-binding protein